MSEAKYLGLTANRLAKAASNLESENAKLREQGERLFDKTLELGTENAKLRELVADMRECALVDGSYACEYGFDGACGKRIAERQRELGVEAGQ